jgi:uncharacterized protein (DUF433 family)
MNVSDLVSPPPESLDETAAALSEQGMVGQSRAYIGGFLVTVGIRIVPDDVLEAAADGWEEAVDS